MDSKNLKMTLLKFVKRAEKYSKNHLIATFVDTGALTTLLSTVDNQIIYGRRGTGKTHALAYLSNKVEVAGEYAIEIDMQNLGSTGGIYGSSGIPITERATRLLMDSLSRIHEELLSKVIHTNIEINSEVISLLDDFAEAITEVYVEGSTEIQKNNEKSYKNLQSNEAKIDLSKDGITADVSLKNENSLKVNRSISEVQNGVIRHRVHFGRINSVLNKIMKSLANKRLWILMDEWSAIPLELQPYLADLLRRSIFPISNITVKIAAIEQRTKFKLINNDEDYIGLEIGGDAAASLNLDEFMVFNNDADTAKDFFKELIYKHIKALIEENGGNFSLDADTVINLIFTQQKAFEEFVKSAEGVPRDAINILGNAVLNSGNSSISIPNIRSAAKTWYNRAKEKDIVNDKAKRLLRWIIDEVIAHRKARAFLLRTDIEDTLINELFDARVLHVLKDNVSARNKPGERFIVYSIDYGCYVDLLQTANAPKGLFQVELLEENKDINDTSANSEVYVDVPSDDYRSIRRAILDINEFYDSL